MAKLAEMVPAGHVLRLAASFDRLRQADCAVPDRCITRQCERCKRQVHWDPMACIPILGPEFILCDICVEGADI